MTIHMEPTNDQKVIRAVLEKAWSNPAFKKNLLEKPVATLEDFLGRPYMSSLKTRLHYRLT